jgi:spermidine synthase
VFAIAAIVVTRSGWRLKVKPLRIAGAAAGIAMLIAGLSFMQKMAFDLDERVLRVRNFYGAVSVERHLDDEAGADIVRFHHGGITHGVQVMSPDMRQEPTSYYGHDSGVGRALTRLKLLPNARAGIVGMGTATVAAYGQKGHTYRFYEINPAVPEIARKHFTYLSDMEARGGKVEIVMGDARLSMEREPPQQFDVLLLDAFSGDSVPVHLLTREAFEIYSKHLKPDGIIAVHVTNRYLLLAPVVEKIAEVLGYKTTRIISDNEGYQEYTDYVLLTKDETFLKDNPPNLENIRSEKTANPGVWTDERHNLYQILDTD